MRECRLLARHLIGIAPSKAIAARYTAACDKLLGAESTSAALRFALANAWAIGPLDAACGLLDRENPLRKRLLILCAILETTPEYARSFLPRTPRLLPLLVHLSFNGACAAIKIALGIPILLALGRS